MKKKSPSQVSIRVPATTANLGPGFDTLGVALKLYNTVTLTLAAENSVLDPFMAEAAALFFKTTQQNAFAFEVRVVGRVPRSRGLGSSVTVRLGIISGLNELSGTPLSPEQVAKLVIDLEGHPDNAVPAYYGGFAACGAAKFIRVPVAGKLKFVACIPDFELSTAKARAVLPKAVPLADAITNLQNSALITAAFLQQDYEVLRGLLDDRLHQPYRAKLIPGWAAVELAAMKAGALGFYLSGAGSTLMALSDGPRAPRVAEAMARALVATEQTGEILVLTADNEGVRRVK
jgi:homoserine kinase